jgi:hypothetical protein
VDQMWTNLTAESEVATLALPGRALARYGALDSTGSSLKRQALEALDRLIGFELQSGPFAVAKLPFEPPEGKVALCPDCMRAGRARGVAPARLLKGVCPCPASPHEAGHGGRLPRPPWKPSWLDARSAVRHTEGGRTPW